MDEMRPYIDGYYLITPFNRVEIIADMITYIHKHVTLLYGSRDRGYKFLK